MSDGLFWCLVSFAGAPSSGSHPYSAELAAIVVVSVRLFKQSGTLFQCQTGCKNAKMCECIVQEASLKKGARLVYSTNFSTTYEQAAVFVRSIRTCLAYVLECLQCSEQKHPHPLILGVHTLWLRVAQLSMSVLFEYVKASREYEVPPALKRFSEYEYTRAADTRQN